MPNSFSQLSNEERNKLLLFMHHKALMQQTSHIKTRSVVRPSWKRQRIPLGNGQAIRTGGCNCGK